MIFNAFFQHYRLKFEMTRLIDPSQHLVFNDYIEKCSIPFLKQRVGSVCDTFQLLEKSEGLVVHQLQWIRTKKGYAKHGLERHFNANHDLMTRWWVKGKLEGVERHFVFYPNLSCTFVDRSIDWKNGKRCGWDRTFVTVITGGLFSKIPSLKLICVHEIPFVNNLRFGIEKKMLYEKSVIQKRVLANKPLEYSRTRTWENGKLNGLEEIRGENGRILKRCFYCNDKRHGSWMEYFSNGQVRRMAKFSSGSRDGLELLYYKNGQIRQIREFVSGYYDGESNVVLFQLFAKSGELIRMKTQTTTFQT